MTDILQKLKEGKSVEVPIYDFQTHSRQKETKRVYGASVVIFEGIMTFHNKAIRDLMDMKGIWYTVYLQYCFAWFSHSFDI